MSRIRSRVLLEGGGLPLSFQLGCQTDFALQLFGQASGSRSQSHTLNSIIPELDKTVTEVEAQIRQLEEEETRLLESIQQTVGGFSDLRYGRLANSQLREEILEGLRTLQHACDEKS